MPDMNNKVQAALTAMRQGMADAAEQKIGRTLTDAERRGIENIGSMMMLESCDQSFSSPCYTPAQILADLEYFAGQAQCA